MRTPTPIRFAIFLAVKVLGVCWCLPQTSTSPSAEQLRPPANFFLLTTNGQHFASGYLQVPSKLGSPEQETVFRCYEIKKGQLGERTSALVTGILDEKDKRPIMVRMEHHQRQRLPTPHEYTLRLGPIEPAIIVFCNQEDKRLKGEWSVMTIAGGAMLGKFEANLP